MILGGEPLPVYGAGDSRRDYTYIDDIVEGILAAIAYDRSMYEVINLGNNTAIGLLDMIAGLEAALGVRARIEYLPAQPGDVPQTCADVGKASCLLGYHPRTAYADGVARFADWLRRATEPTLEFTTS